jgi:glycosyltransferase involved in cell wall biosynthesis
MANIIKFTILITTKNRRPDLIFTLDKIKDLLAREDVNCIICDDGSTDGTSDLLKANYPTIHLIRNENSKGLIYSRNKLLSLTQSEFAISIDDDLHFITENPLEYIENHFKQHPECGLVGFRIFWSTAIPSSTDTEEKPLRMKSFAGGAHAWRMKAWHQIPEYPSWFIFHGEEDFAAYEMFQKNIEIHYLPSVLVHHRVDLKERKKNADYTVRLRRSLRSGWYLYFLFLPLHKIPRLMAYSIWMQLKLKVFKGDFRALKALTQAFFDLIFSFPKIVKHSNRLTAKDYAAYQELEDIKLYWKP